MALGGDRRGGAAAGGSYISPHRAHPGHPLLAASLGGRAVGVVFIIAPFAFHFTGLPLGTTARRVGPADDLNFQCA